MRRAQALPETTSLTVEQVAVQARFESPAGLRDEFAKMLLVSPTGYRRAMGGAAWRVGQVTA